MEIAGHRSLALLVMIGTLSGCAELPVPTRAPFTAAPRSSSAPWQAPPRVAADRSRALASLGEPIDPDVVYGLADLIDFAHRANPETKRAWEDARLQQGLATLPDLLLSRQERARAAYEVEDALGTVSDAQAALAENLGIPPTAPMRVADLSTVPLPSDLAESVEQIIDRALGRRPDLAPRLAALRAREADERKAQAEFRPRLSFSGSVGQAVQRYRVGPPFGTFTMNETEYGAFLNFEWKLFDGFERENALREATSRRGAAEADLAALELRAIREVWKAYADVKTALRKHEFALALLTASKEAYESTLESYRTAGLATVPDVLAAQRDLARARTTEIQSRAELLTTSAALTFAAGD